MRSFRLKIGGYIILFSSDGEEVKLKISGSQKSFVTSEKEYNLVINVSKGKAKPPGGSRPVFTAPYIEEINGIPVKKSDRFWTVFTHGDYYYVNTTLPMCPEDKEALLTVRPEEKSWDLVFDTDSEYINPFCYPLDGLILYYMTALSGDIFIHGSGLEYNGKGYLFSGQSGRGKTTIARLFREAGARVVHDDRLIIRQMPDGSFNMYNTPVYENEESRHAKLDAIFIINHGKRNKSEIPGHSESLATVMANCIQHNWNTTLIANLTGVLLRMVTALPVKKLFFVPDMTVIDYIVEDG